MATMLNIYDTERKKTAVLQNAFSIKETQELNKIYTLDFSIPATDPKTAFILPFHYVRWGEDGELYRIIKTSLSDGDAAVLTVSCEHVIATLVDELMFGITQYGGASVRTAEVISYLLSKQKTVNWILSECDFNRKFEYLWEQENILNALYSVPNEFSTSYKWVFNTHVYPWRVSLKAIDATAIPQYYIRAKRNLLSSGTSQEYTNICTRIYPLGYGEGVNQLTIRSVNNGCEYLQSPAGVVAQYGIREKVLVDRRFENAESLMQYGQTMLEALQVPSMSKIFNVVDLYPLTGDSIDNAQVGNICRMTADNTTAYITKTSRVLDEPGNLQISLSTKASDVASGVADLADRVRIETVYAQGATQIYQHSKDENATKDKGMKLSLYFPSEMRQINKVMLKLKLGKFRSYSLATEQAAAVVGSTSDGGAVTKTTEEGGNTTTTSEYAAQTVGTTEYNSVQTTTTEEGGAEGSTSTNDASVKITGNTGTHWEDADYTLHFSGTTGSGDGSQGWHDHTFEGWPVISRSAFNHDHSLNITGGSHSHTFSIGSHKHSVSISSHQHKVTIPRHQHKVTIPKHRHEIKIAAHSHSITIPAHSHSITAGIFESGNATAFDVYVGGNKVTTVNKTSYDADITNWLLDSKTKRIPRNQWIEVEFRPNDLAYIQSSVFVQGFVQSRGDQTV